MAVAKCPKCSKPYKVRFYQHGWNIIHCPVHGDHSFRADTSQREKVLGKKKKPDPRIGK